MVKSKFLAFTATFVVACEVCVCAVATGLKPEVSGNAGGGSESLLQLNKAVTPLGTESNPHRYGHSSAKDFDFSTYGMNVSGDEWFSKPAGGDGYVLFDDPVHYATNVEVAFTVAAACTVPFKLYSSYFGLDYNATVLAESFIDKTVEATVGTNTVSFTTSDAVTMGDYGYLALAALADTVGSSDVVFTGISLTYTCDLETPFTNPTGFASSTVTKVDDTFVFTHHIKTAAQFRNIIEYEDKYGNNNAKTKYIIDNDIDFNGVVWPLTTDTADNPNGIDYRTNLATYSFSGILDGGVYGSGSVYSGTEATTKHTLKNCTVDWKVGAATYNSNNACGLFYSIKNGVFNSLNISNFDMNIASGKGVGILASGLYLATNVYTATLECNYVTIDETCSIVSVDNTAAFVAYGRQAASIKFDHCGNAADVTCTGSNIGGYIATMTCLSPTLRILAILLAETGLVASSEPPIMEPIRTTLS